MAGKVTRPIAERFWEKVSKDGPVSAHRPDLGQCWEWTACTKEDGYGQFRAESGRLVAAHIVAYILAGHIVPPDRELDHLCRNPRCVNPRHLEPVTHQENMRRGYFGAKAACPQGHPYDEENTYTRPNGSRLCRACKRIKEGYTGVGSHAPKKHCKHGHAFDEANTRITPRGHQVCRTCHRESVRAAKQRKRGDILAERAATRAGAAGREVA